MKIFNNELSKAELMRRLGSLAQVGGLQMLRIEDGPARGVRLLEFRLGSGFNFKVALDRGMDVGYCEYKGIPLGWIPPTLLPGGWFFEQQTKFGWLRTAMGGLCNSCGLLHIGNPENASIDQYNFPGRKEERYGVHDRVAMLSAQLTSYDESWVGNELILKACGRLVQAQVYAENLVLRRTYTAQMGEKCFFMHDEISNEGYYPSPLMLLYHLNFGFPFIDDGSHLVARLSQPAVAINTDQNLITSNTYAEFIPPENHACLQVFELNPISSGDGSNQLAIINPKLGTSGMGVYIKYKPLQLPKLFETRMMGEGHYFVSLEPCTNSFGRAELIRKNEMPILLPGETKVFDLEIGVLDGSNEIQLFQESMKN